MKTIPLSARRRCANAGKYVTLVSEEDYEWARQFHWSGVKHGTRMYARRIAKNADGKKVCILLHRAIWERTNGPIPLGKEIDHRDCIGEPGLDNRRENLRAATRSENVANARYERNMSGYRGVFLERNRTERKRWRASIGASRQNKAVHAGRFECPELAAVAWDMIAIDRWGPFAKTNFDLCRCI
jgi:hypothetical protein